MKKVLTHFDLKLIALLAMTFDHIGKILNLFYPTSDTISLINYIFSIIGRLAFPLFIFLIIEGFYHTHNIKKYFLRLGILALVIYIGILVIYYIPTLSNGEPIIKFGNIFIDLLLTLLFLYFVSKKNYLYHLVVIPIILYFVFFLLVQTNIILIDNDVLLGLISGLAPQYAFITPLLLVLFYIFTLISNFYSYKKDNTLSFNEEGLFVTPSVIKRSYIFSFSILILIIILYALTYVEGIDLNTDLVIDSYFILAVIPLIFYGGGIGKNSKIIQGAFYLYYPLSLCIIYLVVLLSTII